MRRPTRALATVALLAAFPALEMDAQASRIPTAREKRAIARDWAPGTRPSCITVFVSDINERWASLTWAAPKRGENIRRYIKRCPGASNGLAMLNLRKGRWRYITDAGSEMRRDCPIRRVPADIAADLKACFAPERLCDAPEIGALVYAPESTSCEMADQVALAYEADTSGEIAAEIVTVRVKSPDDGLTYSITCLRESLTEVGCDGRRHRLTIRY